MSNARANILSRLRAAPCTDAPPRPHWATPSYGAGRLDQFRTMIQAVHGVVIETTSTDWPQHVRDALVERRVTDVMASVSMADALSVQWPDGPRLVAYDQSVEQHKQTLVSGVQAGITHARAAIAETGSLVLWPDRDEPRLLSLLPPIHVALLRGSTLVDTLADLIRDQGWAGCLPTNALLISGPSKTADIEQTLAYGVHGPKELIVLVLTDV